jgi:hypothetical protein
VNHAIAGLGEVGRAHAAILKNKFYVYEKDLEDKEPPTEKIDVLHIALNYHAIGKERFVKIVRDYLKEYKPTFLSILSTVEPGVTESFGPNAVHSTTRGLHPNLVEGLQKIVKHVGGPKAEVIAKEFNKVGIRCVTHRNSRTSELSHILNNSAYGVSLMFADEMAKLCREYGVDYFEAVMKYTATHNEGFRALDHDRLVRSILTPPQGNIKGHCVTQGATLIPEQFRGPMLSALASYGASNAKEAVVVRESDSKRSEPVSEVQSDRAVLPGEKVGDIQDGEPSSSIAEGMGA